MRSDRPMNSQSARLARMKTSTSAPTVPARARPIAIPRMTKAERMRIISVLGFHRPASEGVDVVNLCPPRARLYSSRACLRQHLFFRPAAEAAHTRRVVGERSLEIVFAEVRPERLGDKHRRIGRLPQEEVADTTFARRPDDQVGVRKSGVVEARGDRGLVDLAGFQSVRDDLSYRVHYLGAAAVDETDVEHAVLVGGGTSHRFVDTLAHARGEIFSPAAEHDAYATSMHLVDLAQHRLVKEPPEGAYLSPRT